MKPIADPRLNLLTVLNVQSARPTSTGKRPGASHAPTRDWHAIARKAQKKSKGESAGAERARRALADKVDEAAEVIDKQEEADEAQTDDVKVDAEDVAFSDADSDDEAAPSSSSSAAKDPFTAHFGPDSALVEGKEAVQLEEEESKWSKGKSVLPGAGEVVWMRPEGVESAVKGEDEALKAVSGFSVILFACGNGADGVSLWSLAVQPETRREIPHLVRPQCVSLARCPCASTDMSAPQLLFLQPSLLGFAPFRLARTSCSPRSRSAATSTMPSVKRARCTP